MLQFQNFLQQWWRYKIFKVITHDKIQLPNPLSCLLSNYRFAGLFIRSFTIQYHQGVINFLLYFTCVYQKRTEIEVSGYLERLKSQSFRGSAPGLCWLQRPQTSSCLLPLFARLVGMAWYLVCTENMKKNNSVCTCHPFKTRFRVYQSIDTQNFLQPWRKNMDRNLLKMTWYRA